MHPSRTLSIGMAVPKESMAGAYVATADHAEVIARGNSGTRHGDIAPLLRKMPSHSTPRVFVSAAGPCGDWLYRALTQKGQVCGVVAPALLPKQPGERGNTTRRDALPLARLRRSGARTPGSVPQGEDAAMRDLCRARAAALRDRTTAPLRLNALRLRHARRATGRAPWGPAHRRGLREVLWPTPAPPRVGPAYSRAGTAHTARLARLDHDRTAQGPPWRLAPVVDALPALRGAPCTVAVPPGAALGARTRCEPPRPLLPSLGVTPSADSPGARRRQGGRTQTGPSHARRALVAGAGAARAPATGRRPRPGRLAQVAQPSQASSGQAPLRLGTRSRQRSARGKHAPQVVVASARERRAWRWAMAQEVPRAP
jgi:transposase